MGDLGNELDKLAAEIEGLARDPQQGQTEHDREHERLTGLVHALESGGDLSGYDPEEVEELRGVLEDIRPALEELVARGALQVPRSPTDEEAGDEDEGSA